MGLQAEYGIWFMLECSTFSSLLVSLQLCCTITFDWIQHQSPALIQLRDQSPALIQLRDQSPALIQLRDQSPALIQLRGKVTAEIPLYDKVYNSLLPISVRLIASQIISNLFSRLL